MAREMTFVVYICTFMTLGWILLALRWCDWLFLRGFGDQQTPIG